MSPLFHLLEGRRGPLLLKMAPIGNYSLWLILAAVACTLLLLVYMRLTSSLTKTAVAEKGLPGDRR